MWRLARPVTNTAAITRCSFLNHGSHSYNQSRTVIGSVWNHQIRGFSKLPTQDQHHTMPDLNAFGSIFQVGDIAKQLMTQPKDTPVLDKKTTKFIDKEATKAAKLIVKEVKKHDEEKKKDDKEEKKNENEEKKKESDHHSKEKKNKTGSKIKLKDEKKHHSKEKHYEAISDQVVHQLNDARMNRDGVISTLEDIKKGKWHGKHYYPDKNSPLYSGENARLLTSEGKDVIEDAIKWLEKDIKENAKLSKLHSDHHLTEVAKIHVDDIGSRGVKGHGGNVGRKDKGENKHDHRMDYYAKKNNVHFALNMSAETIWYGDFHNDNAKDSARMIVYGLIIDDGTSSRLHRKYVFDPSLNSVGVYTGKHATDGNVSVQVFTDDRRIK